MVAIAGTKEFIFDLNEGGADAETFATGVVAGEDVGEEVEE